MSKQGKWLLVGIILPMVGLAGCRYPGAEERTERPGTGVGRDLLPYSDVVTSGATDIVLNRKYDYFDASTTGPNYVMWTRLKFPELHDFELFMNSLELETASADKSSSKTVTRFMAVDNGLKRVPTDLSSEWQEDAIVGGLQVEYPGNCWMISPEKRIVWRYAYKGELVAKLNEW